MRAVGDHVLLADQLAEVGDRLQQAHRADAVGAVARLQAADQLALEDGHEGEEAHQAVDEDEGLDQRDEHPVGHQACPSTVQAPSTGAPSQAKRTAPGASVRESRAVPGRRAARVAHRDGRALGDAEAQRVLAREHDLVAALERESLGARDRGARRTAGGARRRAGRRPPAATCGAARAAREPCRRRGRALASGAVRPIVSQREPGEERRGLGHAAERARRARRRARARGGGRRPRARRARAATPAGARQDGAQALRASLEVRDRAVLLERGGRGQDDVRPERRRRREERARDDRLAALQRGLPALGLGEARERIGVAEHDQHLQRAVLGAAQHLRGVVAVAEGVEAALVGPLGHGEHAARAVAPGRRRAPARRGRGHGGGLGRDQDGMLGGAQRGLDLARGDAAGGDVVEVAAAAAREQQARAAAHGLAHAQLEHAGGVADLALARDDDQVGAGRDRRCAPRRARARPSRRRPGTRC